jgi:hypothetical protein
MASTLASALYVASTSTSGVLTVSDGSGHTETFNLVNYTGAGSFTTQSDGSGGTLVFDPPAATVATDLTAPGAVSTDAQLSPSGVNGNVTFAAASPAGAPSASFTTDNGGASHIGNFLVDPVVYSNGQQSVGRHFALDAAQSKPAVTAGDAPVTWESKVSDSKFCFVSDQSNVGSGNPAGSDSGPASLASIQNDGFVFHQTPATESGSSSNTYPEADEFDHHYDQLFRETTSLKGPDSHTEAAFELIHKSDYAQATSTQMNQVIHVDHALFH